MFCSVCGKEISENAVICTGCGCAVEGKNSSALRPAEKKTQLSLILGIVGIVCAWLFALAGHIVSVIGIIYGIKEYKQSEKISGLAVSIVGEVCSIFSSIIGAVALAGAF